MSDADPTWIADPPNGTATASDPRPRGPEAAAPVRVGRFTIRGELARGGMGVVYRAHDPDLDREVAVKILAERLADRPEAVRRFTDEARVTGRLQHPAIPPVHEVGALPDGRPFLAMKLVEGRTLAELLASARPDPARLLHVFEAVCQAVGFAHSRGVLHRDLKPHNVMVGAFGEVQVMDWGLAKDLTGGVSPHRAGDPPPHSSLADGPSADAPTAVLAPASSVGWFLAEGAPDPGVASGRTAAGSVLGTPGYMAPEQARGEIDRVDRRADVFGLGGVLCAILTGEPPFVGSLQEILAAATKGDVGPAFARLDAAAADGELVALAKRCLAADPAGRPADANEVADALAAYRAGVDDRLRRAELERAALAAKAAELRKRRRVQAALGLAVVAVAGLVGFGLWWQASARADEETRIGRRRDQTEQGVTDALHTADGHLAAARQSVGDPVRWEAATTGAAEAVRRAEELLAAGVGSDDLRARVADARGRADRAERDRRFVERLDAIAFRFLEKEDLGKPLAAYSSRYVQEFQDYGLDPNELAPEEFARRVAALPHREAVWEAMIDWHWHQPYPAGLLARQRLNLRWLDSPSASRRLGRAITLAVADQPFWAAWWDVLITRPKEAIGAALADLARKHNPAKLSPWAIHRAFCDLWNHDRRDDALRVMRAGLERYPSDYRLHARLGLNLRHDPRPELVQEALRHCMAAVALRPKSLNACTQLGLTLSVAGQPEAGLPWIRKAIAEGPATVEQYYALGHVLFAAGKYQDTIVAYEKAAELDPRHPSVYANLGAALAQAGRFDDAITACKRALDLDPTNLTALNNLGVAQGYNLQVTDAVATFRKVLALDPDYASAHFNISGYLFVQGELTECLKHLRRAQALDPKYRKMLPAPPPPPPPPAVRMRDMSRFRKN